MTRPNFWRLTGFAGTVLTILADQLSKFGVMTRVFESMYGDNAPDFGTWFVKKSALLFHPAIEVTSFFNLVMVWNPGISFGMLQTGEATSLYLLSGFAVLVAFGFLAWMWREPRPALASPLALIAGGALGNVLDRLRFGAVADFIDIHVNDLHWPAFNVADAAITVGVVLLLLDQVFLSKQTQRGVRSETV